MGFSMEGSSKENNRSDPFDVSFERLNQMSPAELEEEMERALDAMTEETYDPAVISAYLEAMDRKAPMPTPPDPEEAYEVLRGKLRQEFKGQEQAPISKPPSGRRRSALRMGLVAAAAAVCLLGSMVVAQAAGMDVFGGLARWTLDTFRSGHMSSGEPEETADSEVQREERAEFTANLPPEYQELWTELEARGVYSFLFPTYLPDGFQFDDSSLGIIPEFNIIDFTVWYMNRNDEIAFGVLLSDNTNSTFEKDNGDVEIFEVDGFDHYIFTNNGKNVAVWHSDNLEYSLSTTLSISELKIILESMYQE